MVMSRKAKQHLNLRVTGMWTVDLAVTSVEPPKSQSIQPNYLNRWTTLYIPCVVGLRPDSDAAGDVSVVAVDWSRLSDADEIPRRDWDKCILRCRSILLLQPPHIK